MRTIRVAGLNINIVSADKAFFSARFKAYECDFCEIPDMTIKTDFVDSISAPTGEVCYQKGSVWVLKLSDGRFCRYMKQSKTQKIAISITYTADYSKVFIEILRNLQIGELKATNYEYMYTGFMFANRLAFLGGSVLHGSSFALDGEGIIFSADSGTGKSTHTSLWRDRFGDRFETVNDDKPAVKIEDDKVFIYGTPWSGKTDLNNNIKRPLKAVVFIKRGEDNTCKKMGIIPAVLNFSKQLPNPFYDGEIGAKTVEFIKKLYELHIPVYELSCNISENAVDASYSAIFEGDFL